MNNKKHLIQTNEVSPEIKKSLKVRVITSIVATAIVLPCLFLGDWVYLALILLATGFAGWELVHCAKRKYNVTLYICAILIVLLFACFPILQNVIVAADAGHLEGFPIWSGFSRIYVSSFLILVGIILCFSCVLIDKNFQVHDAAYLFSFGVLIGLGMQSLLFLRYTPMYEMYDPNFVKNVGLIVPEHFGSYDYAESATLLLLVVGGSLFSDMGAYFAGILFGKTKMNERISPKKTWEGFAGGIVVSMIFTLSLGYGMAAAGRPIISIFDLSNWYYLLIVAILIPLVSPLGDFIFSSVKRYYEVKDFGCILPGHGGVLDRIDSVIFASIVTSILIIAFTCMENGTWGSLLI